MSSAAHNSTPRISVITALYNHEKYVAQAIESVLAQTYTDWELIIWDDGSRDQSVEIANRYALAHPGKIRVFTHGQAQNLGQEATRNEALKRARGEFVCLLDSDDYFYPKKFELLLPKFVNPAVGLAYGKGQVLLENTKQLFSAEIPHNPEGKVFAPLVEENFISAAAVLVRRQCLPSSMAFDASFKTIGEYPLWLKIAQSWDFAFCPEPVAVWREHGKNQSTLLALHSRAELVQLCERLVHEECYLPYEASIRRALARKRYDYASELYAVGNLVPLRQLCLKALLEKNATFPIRSKSALLFFLSFLGKGLNQKIARFKRWIWERRHPVAVAVRKSEQST